MIHMNLQFFGGRGSGGGKSTGSPYPSAKKLEGKIFKTSKEAVDAAMETDAIANGEEIYVYRKNRQYVVTQNPEKYEKQGWKEFEL